MGEKRETTSLTAGAIVSRQRDFFKTGRTLDVNFRICALKRLYRSIKSHEKQICDALFKDLGKSETESFMCEIGLTLTEITEQIRHLKEWSRPKRAPVNLANFPAAGYLVPEPYGVALIMSPWNYPFMLTMEPLAGALAAGNCCVVKPSAYSPETSRVIAEILSGEFPAKYVSAVSGGRKENQELLEQDFDYIFFTGSVSVGKMVMEKAARHLTPVTLELGGKSPCLVDRTANLPLAAKRIVFGKFLNCGQTCVAPDYVLAEESVKEELVRQLIRWTKKMFGTDAFANPDYGKIVNEKHFDGICGLIDSEKVVYGGRRSRKTLQIAPTIMDNVSPADAVMKEEIFGPVLAILTVENMDEARRFIQDRPRPLACYIFTSDAQTQKHLVKSLPFGGGCVNDTVMHLTTPHLPFGGIGNSGMGSYHGKKSFETFSHEKSVLKKSVLLDVPVRYQPYTPFKLWTVKKLLK